LTANQMLLPILSPEAQLLFLTANKSTPDSSILRLLESDLDYVELCRMAEREKAVSVLWERIGTLGATRIPSQAQTHLRKLARVTSFRMSYLEQLVVQSTASLDRAGIDYVLLKGAALACSAYGSFEQRPMVDVDILVNKADGNRAVDALLSAGWVWRAEKPRDGDYSHLHHLPALIDPNGLVSTEVHTSILPAAAPFNVSTEGVLASARSIRFRQSEVRVPDPLYLLLHSCIHFAWSHLFRSSAWRTFRDVRTLIKNNDFDWDEFVELALAHKAGSCCFWTLHLTRELVGAQVPDAVLSALRPRLPAVALRALERHFVLILMPTGTPCPSVTLRRVMWNAGIRPGSSGHSRSRPWEVLALLPEDRHRRASSTAMTESTGIRHSVRNWAQYCAQILIGPASSRWKTPTLGVWRDAADV
jgi:hypothetical protein